jgi:mRNA interferase HigB
VHVVNRKVLEEAQKKHGDLANQIASWSKVASEGKWKNLQELRQTWRDTDCVNGITIFNIKGNSYRLCAVVNYESQTIMLREIMTHAEYSKRGC